MAVVGHDRTTYLAHEGVGAHMPGVNLQQAQNGVEHGLGDVSGLERCLSRSDAFYNVVLPHSRLHKHLVLGLHAATEEAPEKTHKAALLGLILARNLTQR